MEFEVHTQVRTKGDTINLESVEKINKQWGRLVALSENRNSSVCCCSLQHTGDYDQFPFYELYYLIKLLLWQLSTTQDSNNYKKKKLQSSCYVGIGLSFYLKFSVRIGLSFFLKFSVVLSRGLE